MVVSSDVSIKNYYHEAHEEHEEKALIIFFFVLFVRWVVNWRYFKLNRLRRHGALLALQWI